MSFFVAQIHTIILVLSEELKNFNKKKNLKNIMVVKVSLHHDATWYLIWPSTRARFVYDCEKRLVRDRAVAVP
jgi:hypothetical protein